MGLGGVVLAGVGIVMVVLAANGRWNNVWAAALGTDTSGATQNVTSNIVDGTQATGTYTA